MKMKFQTSHLWVSPNGKLTQTFSYHWDDVPDLSNEPEIPVEEIDWDEIPDPSETFVNLVVGLVESIRQRDLRIPYLECEREVLSSEEILIDKILHQSPEESIRLLIEIGAHAFPGILKNDIARSLFLQAIIEWISVIEDDIDSFISLIDPALPIQGSIIRLRLIRHRIENLYIAMPLHILPNNLTATEIAETTDCLHEMKKFDESITKSQARFLFACLLGKNFKSNELASASQNNRARGKCNTKDRYPFFTSALKCQVYLTQK
jgi:hypothetical protein